MLTVNIHTCGELLGLLLGIGQEFDIRLGHGSRLRQEFDLGLGQECIQLRNVFFIS